jgi:hypothetical protein
VFGLGQGRLVVCFFVLAVVSALKGLHRAIAPEVVYFYYTNYEFGFILRGLVGQVFAPLLKTTPVSMHGQIMLVWHILSLGVLMAVLSFRAARLVAATGRADVMAMALLLFCSPLIPSLAFFVASPDILLCLVTLGILAAMRGGHPVLAWLLFLLGTIIHQLMVFIALPVMILASVMQANRQWLVVVGSVVVSLLACLVVLMAPPADERFVQRFVEAGITPEGARDLYDFQLRQSLTDMLDKMALIWRAHLLNGLISLTYGTVAAVAILLGCLSRMNVIQDALRSLIPVPPGRWQRVVAVLLAVGAGLGPLVVLALAWDFSRLALLSTFTSFLVAELLFRHQGAKLQRSVGTVTAGSTALAAVLLCLPLLALWPAGMKLNNELPIVRNPVMDIPVVRMAVEHFQAFYDRDKLQPVRVDD